MDNMPAAELEPGHYIGVVRERAGVSQAELARRVGLSPAVMSRIESGDRPVDREEILTFVRALETDDARGLVEYFDQEWLEIPRPPFEHLDRTTLWEINVALGQMKALYANPDLRHVFERQLRAYEDELRKVASILASRDYLVALIGSIGVGKSTMICRITGLEVAAQDGQASLPVLEVGAGGTTICEVHLRRGPGCGLIIEPHSLETIRADVEDFCDYLLALTHGTSDDGGADDDMLGISKETVRAIRNMAKLTPRRDKGPDGRQIRHDPARELARQAGSARELAVEILNRMELPRRDRRDIWHASGSQPALAWLRETFTSVNNGRHPDFSIPKRIEIVLPDAILGAVDLNVRIVDTKGIDQTAERADLECHFDDPHTVVVLCSLFNAAPETALQQLLQRARDAGVRNIDEKSAIVVFPRPGEALAVKDENGTGVENDQDGYELKREDIEMRLQHLRLDTVPVGFFNARSDHPDVLQRFLIDRIAALRKLHSARALSLVQTVRDVIDNYENEQVQAVVEEAAKHLRTWLTTNRDIGQLAGDVHEALIAAMRSAHASTIRATVRREGEWPNLDYTHHLSFGARRLAAAAIGRKVDGFRAIAENLLQNGDLAAAHNLIREAVSQLEGATDDLLRKIQLAGQAAFSSDLTTDQPFWQRCVGEWGRGPGYRDRVLGHNTTWFAAPEHHPQHDFVRHMIITEWARIIEVMEKLLEISALGTATVR